MHHFIHINVFQNYNVRHGVFKGLPTFSLSEQYSRAVFLSRRAAARYRALASIIPGRERPEKTTICYKISLVQLITNLNAILYLSTCHTVNISALILFMIINTYVSLMYELKKIGKVFTSKFVGAGPSSYKKRIYWAAVSQRLRNTGIDNLKLHSNPRPEHNTHPESRTIKYIQTKLKNSNAMVTVADKGKSLVVQLTRATP